VFVIQTSLNDVGPSTQAVPAAEVISTQLLLSQKSSATVRSDSLEEKMKVVENRASFLTQTLSRIEGWRHGGLNE